MKLKNVEIENDSSCKGNFFLYYVPGNKVKTIIYIVNSVICNISMHLEPMMNSINLL